MVGEINPVRLTRAMVAAPLSRKRQPRRPSCHSSRKMSSAIIAGNTRTVPTWFAKKPQSTRKVNTIGLSM